MLRQVLLALGALLLLGAALAALCGHGELVPQLLVGGVLLTAGIVYERWRYKATRDARPDPHWQATGERFIDPESGTLTEVWFDPRSGERHYLRAPPR